MLCFSVVLCLAALMSKTGGEGKQEYKIHFNIPSSCKEGFMLMNPDNEQILQFSYIHSHHSHEVTITIGDGCYVRSDQESCVIEGRVPTLGLYHVIPNDDTNFSCNKTFVVQEDANILQLFSTQTTQIYSNWTTENPSNTSENIYLDVSTKAAENGDETSPLMLILGGSTAGFVLVMIVVIVRIVIARKRQQSRESALSEIHTVNRSEDNRNFTERTLTSRCSERYGMDNSVNEIEDDPVYIEIDNIVMADEVVTYDYVTNQDLEQRGDTGPETVAVNDYYLTPVNGRSKSNLAADEDNYIPPVYDRTNPNQAEVYDDYLSSFNDRTNPKTVLYETLRCTSSDESEYQSIGQENLLQRSK